MKTQDKDLLGKRFERLIVLRRDHKSDRAIKYLCLCDCGNIKSIAKHSLLREYTKSCGCLRSEASKKRRTINMSGKIFNRWKVLNKVKNRDGYYLCKCECGTLKEVKGSDMKAEKSKSCGCLNLELTKERWSGPNNPWWNPNLSNADRLNKRNIADFRDWRKSVYERDSYVCQKCKSVGGRLNAHHLDGWHWCKEKRFDLDNGVTLCEKCHKTFHQTFGKSNNTRQQFIEYINE